MRLIGKPCGLEWADMITVGQIRAMIQQLTLFKISLDDFEEWFTAASWNAHQSNQNDARETMQLIGKIELCLAEGESKSYSQVLQELAKLVGFFSIGSAPIATTSGSVSIAPQFQFEQSAVADTRFSMGLSYTPVLTS